MTASEEFGQSVIQVQLVDGTLLSLPDSIQLLSTYVLQEQGDWFEDEIKFLRQLVQPGQTVIDIGANYGVYALSLARCVGPNGQVWAFEPAADTASHLAAAIVANGTNWVRLEQQALSDHEGTAWLSKSGQSELNRLASAAEQGPLASQGDGESVSLTTLDACLDRFGWTEVDLLKIDAEGEEQRILAGGRRFFHETSPLVMFELKEGARLHLELINSFQALGYRCFRLVPGLAALVPFDLAAPVDAFLLNLFAAKPDRIAALAAAGWLLESEPVQTAETASGESGEGQNGERAPERGLPELETLPYGQALAPLWHDRPDPPGAAEHKAALVAWRQAHDRSLPLPRRWGALRRSYTLLSGLCQGGGPACRCASLARVALDLGERERVLTALGHLHGSLQRDGEAGLAEPFLPPHPSYDVIDPQGRPVAWLESAALEAEECFSSYSSFFTGTSALPRLQRIAGLGLATPAMARRLQMVQTRFPRQTAANTRQPDPATEETTSVRPWFDSLELERPLRCLDVGAMALTAEMDPWVRWALEGCADVIGFEPLPEECALLNQRFAELGGRVRYLPVALGDGGEHLLHVTHAPMTSSLFPPDLATAALFSELADWLRVEREETLRTSRLDDLADVRPVDFLKLDVQGAELMVLRHATATLADVAVVQCEVEFVQIYAGQPLMADVDAFMRSQGFGFLRFTTQKGLPLNPVRLARDPYGGISQLLWADAVYVRDYRQFDRWSSRQLKAAAFVAHELYQAFDLVALLLSELDRRQQSDWRSCYLASLLLTDPNVTVG